MNKSNADADAVGVSWSKICGNTPSTLDQWERMDEVMGRQVLEKAAKLLGAKVGGHAVKKVTKLLGAKVGQPAANGTRQRSC